MSKPNYDEDMVMYVLYMDAMSRMIMNHGGGARRFKNMQEAADNWLTVSEDVKKHYNGLINHYLTFRRETVK